MEKYLKLCLSALVLILCASAYAQDIEVIDFSEQFRIFDKKAKHKYVFLESFLESDAFETAYNKIDPYDPTSIFDIFNKYGIGQRSWYDALELGNGYAAVSPDGKLWGVMNNKGEIKIPIKYGEIVSYNPKLKRLAIKNAVGKCGVMTYEGEAVSEFKYSSARVVSYYSIATYGPSKMVLLSTDGKEISAFYSDMDTFTFKDENGKSYTTINVKDAKRMTGAINSEGKVTIPLKYTRAWVSNGKDFGKPENVRIYWCGIRKENGKEIVDYYDVRNFEIVHTAPYVEKDWF